MSDIKAEAAMYIISLLNFGILAMNFLLLIFNKLFNEKSFEKGAINAARVKLSRKFVKKEMQHHSDHAKEGLFHHFSW